MSRDFLTSPSVPDPTAAAHATTKNYVDTALGAYLTSAAAASAYIPKALTTGNVLYGVGGVATSGTPDAAGLATKAGAQSFSGVKTFGAATNLAGVRLTTSDWSNTGGISSGGATHNRVDSSAGSFLLQLPSIPSPGQLVIVEDAIGACGVNAVTIGRNGNKIGGVAADLSLNIAYGAFTLLYDDIGDWKILSRPEFKNAVQPADSNLDEIAAATFANDDFIQRKAGVLTNRTIAQVKADLGVTKSILMPHTFSIGGTIAAASGDTNYIPPFFVKAPAGQTVKLVSARYRINSGTSVSAKIQINGVDATGFTGMSVTTTVGETDPTDVTLADNDMIALVVSSPVGTPKNMTVTLFLEYTV